MKDFNLKNYNAYQIDRATWRIEDAMKVYMYLVEGEESALLIDTGMGFGGLVGIVRELTHKPVRVVNTHGHVDHIGSNYLFDHVSISRMEKDAIRDHLDMDFRRVFLPQALKDMIPGLGLPEIQKMIELPEKKNLNYVDEGDIFDLGGRRLEVLWTPGHTPGSICLLDRENRQLFSGDTVCAKGILLIVNHSGTVETFRNSMKKLYDIRDQFKYIYPGHHEVPIDIGYVEEYIQCASEIIEGRIENQAFTSGIIGRGLLARHKRISIAYRESHVKGE